MIGMHRCHDSDVFWSAGAGIGVMSKLTAGVRIGMIGIKRIEAY
jgi:hypothetical protein